MVSTFTFLLFCLSMAALLVSMVWAWANEPSPPPGDLGGKLVFWALWTTLNYYLGSWFWNWLGFGPWPGLS